MSSFYKFVDTNSQRINLKKCTFSRRHLDDRLLDEWAAPAAAASGWPSSNNEQVHSIILSLDAHVNNKRRKRCIWSVMLWLFCTGCVGRSRCLYTLQGGCAALYALCWRALRLTIKAPFSPHLTSQTLAPRRYYYVYVTKGCWRGVPVYLSFSATLSRCSIICRVKIMLRRSGIYIINNSSIYCSVSLARNL
jgi:hypothetical protein